ncbi:MAG: hypothetical protein PHZ05_02475 [Pygmaiobacter massiliensis]|nr:hypothetical protein [Pygmaiobacter massiliensis]
MTNKICGVSLSFAFRNAVFATNFQCHLPEREESYVKKENRENSQLDIFYFDDSFASSVLEGYILFPLVYATAKHFNHL